MSSADGAGRSFPVPLVLESLPGPDAADGEADAGGVVRALRFAVADPVRQRKPLGQQLGSGRALHASGGLAAQAADPGEPWAAVSPADAGQGGATASYAGVGTAQSPASVGSCRRSRE